MNRAEIILAEFVQSVEGTADAASIPYVMKGSQGPAHAIEHLIPELGLSRTSLFRKVKSLTDLSTNELIRNYRLKRAAQLLRQGQAVNQTAYQVGFDSPAYFSKCFRELYQLTPSEFAAQE
jgi:AraC-like DNA-binding protein